MAIQVYDYQVVNGTSYKADTTKEIIDLIERFRHNNEKIRVFYGDTETGRDWLEEYDTMGTIGRSTGIYKVPLLIKNARSIGGGSILDNRIIRIDTKDSSGKIVTVYQNSKYVKPEFEIMFNEKRPDDFKWEANQTNGAGGVAMACNTKERAEKWVKFIRGERWAK